MVKQQFRGAQRRARQLGVTLIESMVVVGIAGALAAIGGPNLNHFRDKAAVEAQFQSFDSALRRARSEAMTRGELMTVCAMDPATAASQAPSCLPSGKDWSAGWLVFVDRGLRGDVGEGDVLVHVEPAPANAGSIVGTQRYLTYRAGGELLSIAAHFRFLPPGQPAVDSPLPGSALVCVNKTGRARPAKDARCLA